MGTIYVMNGYSLRCSLKDYLLSIYYVPSSIANAGVTMVNCKSPGELQSTGDKSVNKDINQRISDPDKSCEANKA